MAPVKRTASEAIDKEERINVKDASIHKKALIDAIANDVDEEDITSSDGDDVEKKGDNREERDSDDNDDDGDEEEEEDEQEDRKGRTQTNLTSQDIQIARETAELFKSNIFKLQIDELLQQVKLKDSNILKVEKFLHKLYDIIQEVPNWEERSISEVESYFKGKIVAVPFVDPKPNASTQYKFNYKTPDVSLVGSFALKAAIYQPQGSSVDVLLTMPEELFDKKDFLNFRCIHKRSVYLAYLTHHLSIILSKHGLMDFLQLDYEYFNNDPLQPILKLSCKTAGPSEYNFYKTKSSINLIVGFPYGLFDPKKLLPNKNCIRVQQDNTTPTPFYNFSVLASTTHDHYLKNLYKSKKQTEAFKEACVLGRLWLKQRGFTSKISYSGSLGGFGPFEFAILMSALLNGGGVNGNRILLHGFSSYQLFKGVIKYLATMDLCSEGYLQFYSDLNSTATLPTSKYIEEGFQTPTIFDKVTKVNILNKMSHNSYQILKIYAQETLSMLNDVVKDQFGNIFLTNLNKLNNIKYDACYDLELPTHSVLLSKFGSLEKVRFISFENFLVNKISNIVKIALGDRIKSFEVELCGHKNKFSIAKRKPSGGANFSSIKIKLLINPAESEKLVTRGPANTEELTTEAINFKNFWGKKASLRRFKDGSITHCCVWSTSASEPVISSILGYVVKQHLTEDAKLSNPTLKQFHELLPLPNLPASSKTSVLNLGSYQNLKKSFDDLFKIMFQLDLPLSIKSILPVGSAFRYSSLCQPVPFAYSNPDFLQDVILEFESSPKWPDEITSLEKAKTAFLLKIQEQIDSKHSGNYKTFFTRDESIPFNLEITTLNILTPEGYGFKFRVLTERDEVLYLRAINNARNELKPELEKTFLKFTAKYLASIRHNRTLENISHSYQLYSPVVRLFKKWLDCHLLSIHLSDELIELLAIKPFVESAPFLIPGSVENGFLKVLRFLSQWNWKEDPLILDLVKPEDFQDSYETSIGAGVDLDAKTMRKLSEKLTLQQYKAIQGNFANLRNGDPQGLNLQFFVASKNDPSGILYSSGIPLPIATRLTALAKVALNLIQTHGLNKQTIDLLFTPALKDYDFVVQLKTPTPLRLSSGILEPEGFKNLNQQLTKFPSDLSELSEKMDPTYQMVKYLNMKYKNSIIFSSHRYVGVNGGEQGDRNVITGLIKPLFKSPLRFKVNMDCNVKPVDKEIVELNREAIFHEIAAFGNELVTKFDVN